MTQLYSNLVYYVGDTTYLCLMLVVLGSPKVSRVRLASLHTASLLHQHNHSESCAAWQAFPFY